MKKIALFGLLVGAVAVTGCTSISKQELESRIVRAEESVKAAHLRADKAEEVARQALVTSQKAEQTAAESNERGLRILERTSKK